jgi:hypothetical protein
MVSGIWVPVCAGTTNESLDTFAPVSFVEQGQSSAENKCLDRW